MLIKGESFGRRYFKDYFLYSNQIQMIIKVITMLLQAIMKHSPQNKEMRKFIINFLQELKIKKMLNFWISVQELGLLLKALQKQDMQI